MNGFIGQTANGIDDRFAFDRRRLRQSQANKHLGQRRAAGYRSDASASTIAGLGDASGVELQGELHDVAASRILYPNRSISTGDLAHVARVLEMLEQLGGVHAGIVLQPKLMWGGRPRPPRLVLNRLDRDRRQVLHQPDFLLHKRLSVLHAGKQAIEACHGVDASADFRVRRENTLPGFLIGEL